MGVCGVQWGTWESPGNRMFRVRELMMGPVIGGGARGGARG